MKPANERRCWRLRRQQESHGMTGTPEYGSYAAMIARCYIPSHTKYGYYGGRGIKVCWRWKKSFLAFFHDMGQKPTPKHTIDRINNAKGYTPNNCRWATMQEQLQNRRRPSRDRAAKVREAMRAYMQREEAGARLRSLLEECV